MDLETLLAEREITPHPDPLRPRDGQSATGTCCARSSSTTRRPTSAREPLEGSEALIACIRSYLDACGRDAAPARQHPRGRHRRRGGQPGLRNDRGGCACPSRTRCLPS
ncbi:hypothetical protein ACU686_44830 [Yinghuangia aomiensis]